MKRVHLLPSILLGLALLSPIVRADEIQTYDAQIKTLDQQIGATREQTALTNLIGERGSAFRLRGLEHEKLFHYEEAKQDYILCLNDTRKSAGKLRNREAEMFARIAHCQFKLGDYKNSSTNMASARTAAGYIANEPFFLENSATIRLANEEYEAAITDCIALRAAKVTNLKKANSYMLEATAIYLRGDYEGAMTKWKEIAVVSPGLAALKPFDSYQTPLNRAVAKAPQDLTARLNRIRFFRNRANQKRYPKLYISNSPVTQGGLTNLIDPEVFDVQPHSFYQSAYYDWTKIIEIKDEPAYHAERALVGHLWNEVAKESQKLLQSEINNDINYAIKNSGKNGETLRSIGRFYEDSSPNSVYDPKWRATTRNAITYYSLALIHDPTFAENDKLRETRNTRINFNISAKPPEPPKVTPTTPLQWKERGNELTSKEQFSAALDAYDKAIKIDSQFADAYNNKGNIYLRLGAYDLALDQFDAAIKADPKHRIAYYNLSTTWEDLGDMPKAFDNAGKAIQFAATPEQKTATLNHRANLYFNSQQYPQALTDLTALLTLAPKNAPAWAFRGQTELMLKHLTGAVESLEKAVALDPARERTKFLLVTAQHLSGAPAPDKLEGSVAEKEWLHRFLVSKQFTSLFSSAEEKRRVETLIELTK